MAQARVKESRRRFPVLRTASICVSGQAESTNPVSNQLTGRAEFSLNGSAMNELRLDLAARLPRHGFQRPMCWQ